MVAAYGDSVIGQLVHPALATLPPGRVLFNNMSQMRMKSSLELVMKRILLGFRHVLRVVRAYRQRVRLL